MLSNERQQQLIELCQNLIQAESYSGNEGEVVNRIRTAMENFKFDEIYVDRYGNIIGGIHGNRPGPTIVMDGHIDTVPVNDPTKWKQDPFGGAIVDGKIYGRGTSDMKGAVSSMLAAIGFFAEDFGRNFAGKVYLSGVVHEECFEGVAARAVTEKFKPDLVVIGECSELNLKRAQRGRAEIVVETFGIPAHSANPDKGLNAVYLMADIIGRIRKLPTTEHPVLGKGILELTDIKSAPYPGASVVPEYCRATYDRRLLVGENLESVLAPLQALIDQWQAETGHKARVSYARAEEMCFTGNKIEGERFFPGWVLDTEHAWVKTAINGLKSVGINPEITQYSFCTNGSHYAGEAGIPTIGFGPSRENLAHTNDEYVEIDQLVRSNEGYYGILREALTK